MRFFSLDDIRISSSTRDEIREYLKRTLSDSPLPQLWVTFNLDFFRISNENNTFRAICRNADLVLPDGNGILHLLKAKTCEKVKRVTGNDVLDFTLQISSSEKIRAAFVGSTTQVMNDLVAKVKKEYPKLQIAAAISPPFNFENDAVYNNKLVSELKESKPDILFLALGCPRQEIWLDKNKTTIGAKVNIGVGAAFDFFTGHRKRSPKFLQDISMEWFWRMLQEPRRLSHRYLVKDFPFFLRKYSAYKFHPNAEE